MTNAMIILLESVKLMEAGVKGDELGENLYCCFGMEATGIPG